MENLVFFLMWEVVKDRCEVDATFNNCVWAYETQNRKRNEGNGQLTSYRASNIIHTKRWSIVGWTTRKTLPFCFCPFWLHHAYVEKIPGSLHDTYSRSGRAWERGYPIPPMSDLPHPLSSLPSVQSWFPSQRSLEWIHWPLLHQKALPSQESNQHYKCSH